MQSMLLFGALKLLVGQQGGAFGLLQLPLGVLFWKTQPDMKLVDQESNKTGRLIIEAVWLCKCNNMNSDEGSSRLSHIMGKLLTEITLRKSALMMISDWRSKR